MSPITHFLTGWLVANASGQMHRRERAMITLAAVAPDLDGLGVVADFLTRSSEHPLNLYSDYHHILGHNIGFGIVLALIAFSFATRRWLTAALALVSFHLHLLCDLAGSRSPDGYQWLIPYLLPFSNELQITWDGQWELNAWPNFIVTGVALVILFVLAWKRGNSPLEMISVSANRAFVETLRRRLPMQDRGHG
jgi:LexA-binding, inner membrane-associated putative hydrolase